MPPIISGRLALSIQTFISSTALSPASMETPAEAYVVPAAAARSSGPASLIAASRCDCRSVGRRGLRTVQRVRGAALHPGGDSLGVPAPALLRGQGRVRRVLEAG